MINYSNKEKIKEVKTLKSLNEAAKIVQDALKTNPDYLYGWFANLCRSAQDENVDVAISKAIAFRFLHNFTGESSDSLQEKLNEFYMGIEHTEV